MLERSTRLLRFKQRLEVALEKQKLLREASDWKIEKAFLESVKSHGCPFYGDCPYLKDLYPFTYCITEYRYCDEYRRRDDLRRQGLTRKIDKTG